MANLKRKPRCVWSLRLRCSSGCRFSAFSCGVRPAKLVFSPCCGRFWFVPRSRFLSSGRPVAWSPGVPLSPAAVLPARQLSLFD